MNKLLRIIFIFLSIFVSFNESFVVASPLKTSVAVYYDKQGNKYVYVKGYTKKDGTVVKGYYRSFPNKDKTDNWSAKGNINPLTGKKGYE